MNTTTDCERVRLTLMASLDGESKRESSSEAHLSACASCRHWLDGLQTMTGQLEALAYPSAPRDLWSEVAARIDQREERQDIVRRLWPIAGFMLAWRALQLFIDLPLPMVHLLIPLTATIAALWLVAGDGFAIQTSAPELQKRGA